MATGSSIFLNPQYFEFGVENLGITYAAGVFTITDRNGVALSASNPGYVTMPSTTPGRIVRITVNTATNLFGDATASDSDIVGEEFGTTAGVAWGSAPLTTPRPFYLYACNFDDTDTNLRFFISPNPMLTVSPSSINNIGYSDNVAGIPSDNNAHFLTTTNVRSGNVYTSKPVLCIGSFQMTKSSADDWTVSTLIAGRDGIGRFQEGVTLIMPLGQMGATAGKYMANNGGTAPVWQSQGYFYQVDPRTGLVWLGVDLSGDAGADGAGAVAAQLAAPYNVINLNLSTINICRLSYNGGANVGIGAAKFLAINTSLIHFNSGSTNVVDQVEINNSVFSAGTRAIYFTGSYKAF